MDTVATTKESQDIFGSQLNYLSATKEHTIKLLKSMEVSLEFEDSFKIRESVSRSILDNFTVTKFLIEDLLINLKEKNIMISKSNDIYDYLLDKLDMIDFLASICSVTFEKFQDSSFPTQLSLEMYHDPEIEDSYLTLYIRQNEYDKNIFNKIDEICDEFQEQFAKIKGWLLITTDFKHIG